MKSKLIWTVVIVAALGGGYWWYSSSTTASTSTRYAFATVAKDTVVTTVDGTGQVSGNRQLDVKPRVGARVTKVLVKVGDKVTAGQQLVDLDRTEALKTVRDAAQSVSDARISLESSQLSLEKTRQPNDSAAIMQAENSLAKAKRDLETLKAGPTEYQLKQAQADVDTQLKNLRMSSDGQVPQVVRDAYDEYVTELKAVQQAMTKSVEDADGILGIDKPVVKIGLTRMFAILNDSTEYQARQSYQLAKTAVDATKTKIDDMELVNEDIKNIESVSTEVSIALDKTADLLSGMADALQATMTSSDLTQSDLDSLKTLIENDKTTVNAKITSLFNQQQAVQQAKDSYDNATINYQKALNTLDNLKQGATAAELTTAQESVNQAQAQYDKVKSGADPIDLKIAQNSVARSASSLKAAQIKLEDANQQLSYYSVVAPFDGIVGAIPIQPDEDVSAGTAVVTLVTTQQIATISLNEVDAAKVQVGQKATMTFDAIDGLSMTGEVAQVSPIGTVSQGVVSYEVQIGFDAQDDRIKSGMSVTTAIVAKVKADVLTVPNSAVKTQGDVSYVETIDGLAKNASSTSNYVASSETPRRITVEVGISNDTLTEITSGLTEGEMIITQTIKSGTQSTTSGTTSNSNVMRSMGAMTGGAPPGR